MQHDITILTEQRYDKPANPDAYAQNILLEDRLISEALQKHGLRVQRRNWADPDVDWSACSAALFRTTWDYFDKFEQFKNWLQETSGLTRFINPLEIIRWNMDKHYLLDLEKAGINIPSTIIIPRNSGKSLREWVDESGWDKLVLKPTIAGTARHTYKLHAETIDQHEDLFTELNAKEDMMIQPFMNNVVEKGEVSLVMIGGIFSHAVLKKAKDGDFRVQDDFGGSLHHYTPTSEEVRFAMDCIEACSPQPHYARVDMIWDNEGNPAVGELELIEPELWFRRHEPAADALAAEIVKHYF
jgi:hypothetical protein